MIRPRSTAWFAAVVLAVLLAQPGCFLAGPLPPEPRFWAAPETICSGEASVLEWSTRDDGNCADGCVDTRSLDPGPGSTIDPMSRIFRVRPTVTTPYAVSFGACREGGCSNETLDATVTVVQGADRFVRELAGYCGPRWESLDLGQMLSPCLKPEQICLDDAADLPTPILVRGERPDGERIGETLAGPGSCTEIFSEHGDWTIHAAPVFDLEPGRFSCDLDEEVGDDVVGTPAPPIRLLVQARCDATAECSGG